MFEVEDDDLVRYRCHVGRCHVGHTYTAELMNLAQDDNLRRALGTALRALNERAARSGAWSMSQRRKGSSGRADETSDPFYRSQSQSPRKPQRGP